MAQVDALQEPKDLISEIRAYRANEWWSAAAPSYRRDVLRWTAGAEKYAFEFCTGCIVSSRNGTLSQTDTRRGFKS